MSTQKKLRVGVIGAGDVAQVIHLPILPYHACSRQKAVCDVSEKTGLLYGYMHETGQSEALRPII